MRRLVQHLVVGLSLCLGNVGALAEPIALPSPATDGEVSLEQSLSKRRSTRTFAAGKLTPKQLGQLAWATQGVTSRRGFRTAPSAGARYPLILYIATADGVFQYLPKLHALKEIHDNDIRPKIWKEVYNRPSQKHAAAWFVIAGRYERTRERYGNRAERYVLLEAGHACQNLLLQATALDLGAVSLGAFRYNKLRPLLQTDRREELLYLVPVGRLP